jgi:hypothetical protein
MHSSLLIGHGRRLRRLPKRVRWQAERARVRASNRLHRRKGRGRCSRSSLVLLKGFLPMMTLKTRGTRGMRKRKTTKEKTTMM